MTTEELSEFLRTVGVDVFYWHVAPDGEFCGIIYEDTNPSGFVHGEEGENDERI
jgi:hypothetical protein